MSKKHWRQIYSFIYIFIVQGVFCDAPQPWTPYCRSLEAESGSPKKMNIVNAIAYLFWIFSINNIIGGNTKAIPGKFVIKVYILYISVR